MSVDRGLHV